MRKSIFTLILGCFAAQASIQYPTGAIVFASFTQALGTRAEMVNKTEDELNAAGWTTISGHHSASVIVQSGTTPTALNQVRMNLIDPGSGHCMQIKMQNVLGTLTSQAYFVLSDVVGTTWTFWANQFTFAVYTPGGSVTRQFVMGGTLYIPAFLQGVIIGDLGWIQGNSSTDNGSSKNSFRSLLNVFNSNGTAWNSALINGTLWNDAAGNSSQGGQQLIGAFESYWGANSNTTGYRWHDQTQFISDPVIAFGLTSSADEAMARGQIWGAAILSDSWSADTALSFDTHNWTAITNSNIGSSANWARGTLVVAIN